MLSEPKPLEFAIAETPLAPAHRVACVHWGEPSSPAVLCVHGLTRNGRDFDFLAQALVAQGYQVFCPDTVGRGKSEWLNESKAYGYPLYLSDLLQITAQINIPKLHWIGTSMGGILGMMMAGAKPGLIQSLVLNDIGCHVPAIGLKRILAGPSGSSYATLTDAEEGLRTRLLAFGITKEEHWQHMFAHGIQLTKRGDFRLAFDPAIISNLAANEPKDVDLWPLWEAVKAIPTLLLRGIESDLLTRETAQAMKAQHPNLTLQEIPAAGHAPALMEDSQINIITDWLRP